MRNRTFGILLLFALSAATSLAATITFGSENRPLTIATPYEESGFRLSVITGTEACLQPVNTTTNSFFAFGCSNSSAINDIVQLRLTSGGTFTFSGIDVGGLQGSPSSSYDTVSILGYLNSNLVGSMANIQPTVFNGFNTRSSTIVGPVDQIEFRLTATSTYATLFDNVVVTPVSSPVPEPNFAALGASVLVALCWRFRK